MALFCTLTSQTCHFSFGQPTVHVAQRMRQFAVAFYLQESSPYRDPLNRALESLLEAGINDKILRDALSRLEVKNAVQGPEKLGLEDTRPAFVVLILFGSLSCFSFIIEMSITWMEKLLPTLKRNLKPKAVIRLPDSMH